MTEISCDTPYNCLFNPLKRRTRPCFSGVLSFYGADGVDVGGGRKLAVDLNKYTSMGLLTAGVRTCTLRNTLSAIAAIAGRGEVHCGIPSRTRESANDTDADQTSRPPLRSSNTFLNSCCRHSALHNKYYATGFHPQCLY